MAGKRALFLLLFTLFVCHQAELIAYYPCDKLVSNGPNGQISDQSRLGFSSDCSFPLPQPNVTGAMLLSGRYGSAYRFLNATSRIDAGVWSLNSSQFTISLWFRFFNPNNTDGILVTKSRSTVSTSWEIQFAQGYIVPRFQGQTQQQYRLFPIASAGFSTNSSQWNHIAFSFDGIRFRFAVNGEFYSVTINDTLVETPTLPVTIGNGFGLNQAFQGDIDDVRIYDVGLDTPSILAIYTANQVPSPPQYNTSSVNATIGNVIVPSQAIGQDGTASLAWECNRMSGWSACNNTAVQWKTAGNYTGAASLCNELYCLCHLPTVITLWTPPSSSPSSSSSPPPSSSTLPPGSSSEGSSDPGEVRGSSGGNGVLPLALGVGIGGGVLLLCLIVVLVIILRRKRRVQSYRAEKREISMEVVSEVYAGPEVPRTATGDVRADFSEYLQAIDLPAQPVKVGTNRTPRPTRTDKMEQIDQDDIKLGHEIGRGVHGSIAYLGTWKEFDVAIKIYHDVDEMTKLSLHLEKGIANRIRPHPNVVSLLGVCYSPLSFVMEYLELGSLQRVLNSEATITQETCHGLMRGIARGMNHLHFEKVIHKDLAARNVLLGIGMIPKVADFGLSRIFLTEENLVITSETEASPVRWMAPESILDKSFTNKSDVWSFGVTCLEILTRKVPWHNLTNINVMAQVSAGSTPVKDIPEATHPILKALLKKCLDRDPDKRPDFKQICSELEMIPDVESM